MTDNRQVRAGVKPVKPFREMWDFKTVFLFVALAAPELALYVDQPGFLTQ